MQVFIIITILTIVLCVSINFGYAQIINNCEAPPQPQNGYYKLHGTQCGSGQDCDIAEGVKLDLGSLLVYSCNPGYELKGSTYVSCSLGEKLLNIPVCTEIRCKGLSTESTDARCTYNNVRVLCESSVLPGTVAQISCQDHYYHDPDVFALQADHVRCNENGRWDPEPIQCVPECGILPADIVPQIINGTQLKITEYPWHASMYRDFPNVPKKYFCGATIIQDNLLVTAAHCIYDDDNKRIIDANRIYILAGNIFRDYDSPNHDMRVVQKARVKNIYINCNYLGLTGNYLWDIAVLELTESFQLSNWLFPACLDSDTDDEQTILKAGVYGKIAGFAKTAAGDSNPILQSLNVPYVPPNQCKLANQDTETEQYITLDKFCAGYTNGSSVCDGDSGDGLVFKTNGLWYLRGIVTVFLNKTVQDRSARCDNNLYTVYTRVSNHVAWIEDIMTKLDQIMIYPSCPNNSLVSNNISTNNGYKETTNNCEAPPQLQNGYWKLHRTQCASGQDCDVAEGVKLESGSHLVYFCNPGYEPRGPIDVSCSLGGKWLQIPVCTEIRCKALNTASTTAECTFNNELVSCESPVLPGTVAQVSCRNSYRRENNVYSLQSDSVRCNKNGEWNPEPIRCVPVCGILPANIVPQIVNGTRPNITEFPWHASMYRDFANTLKEYFCGATIIQENLLVTAAHCVYDERNKQVINASRIYIVTGNIYRDYDSPYHDMRIVQKARVKNIYINCNYLGLIGNYLLDIAVLELIEPFVLSSLLVPACLDFSTNNDIAVLESGVYGKVAGFGRTAIGDSSAILQALNVPYVPFHQCKSASQDAETEQFITIDKFCAGYTNGSSICDGDSGSGLTFKTKGLWYLRGIVSVSLGTILHGGKIHCDNNKYTLYTRVSNHITWIQDIMRQLEQNKIYPLCSNNS